jgi:type IV pilus assembly protein PilE
MRGPRQSASGFTLIELMIVVALAAVMALIALPTFTDQIRKSRRADAITRIAQVQQAQERWRANNATYTSNLTAAPPTGLGLPATVAGGHYMLSVVPPGSAASAPFFYDVIAQATGSQTADTNCAFMRARYDRGTISLASGPNASVGNGPAVNNRCWNR